MKTVFWRWFLRINARAVFLLASLLLILAVLFWVLRQESGERSRDVTSMEKTVNVEMPRESEGTREPWKAPQAHRESPFSSGYLKSLIEEERADRLRRLAEEKRKAEEVARKAMEEAARKAKEEAARLAREEAAARKAKEEAAARKKRRKGSVSVNETRKQSAQKPPDKKTADKRETLPPVRLLVYRGMMTGTDGITVALIEDMVSGEVALYRLGDALEGYRIGEISRGRVSLARDDDSCQILEVGRETTIVER